jgi:hypothetical protein
MSAYQYYEFVAVDRPLTAAQQDDLRALSTRARITASTFVNDYQWGDLKGDPRAWMERYFDAHLYLANWGTHRIALRLPIGLLDPDTASVYCVGESARSWATREHVILDLSSEAEGDDWWEGEGRLASIVPARAELAAGDMRLLYLAWLLCVQSDELDDGEVEPPVPPGLDDLSGPLRSLVDFLRLDRDLLAVAAEASGTRRAKAPSAASLTRWVKGLPAADKDAAMVRLLRGDAHLRAELLRRYDGPSAGEPTAGVRTVGELLGNPVAGDHDGAWRRVADMIETRRPKEYDAAVEVLADLKCVSEREHGTAAFGARIRRLREEHARKASLLDRLDRAGLR